MLLFRHSTLPVFSCSLSQTCSILFELDANSATQHWISTVPISSCIPDPRTTNLYRFTPSKMFILGEIYYGFVDNAVTRYDGIKEYYCLAFVHPVKYKKAKFMAMIKLM